jgi:hypothetical protein
MKKYNRKCFKMDKKYMYFLYGKNYGKNYNKLVKMSAEANMIRSIGILMLFLVEVIIATLCSTRTPGIFNGCVIMGIIILGIIIFLINLIKD